MATATSLYGDVIPVNIRSNNTECSNMVVQCEREWNVERVKQEIERNHPGHYPTQSQVIYYCGRRIPDSEPLTSLFQQEPHQPNTNPQYTLWLGVLMENKVFQEFLSLPKPPNTGCSEVVNPNMGSTHPYASALKYYNYITSVQSQMKTVVKDAETVSQPNGDAEANPAVDNAEQGGEGDPEQEGDAFNFLGGRLDRPQGIAPEEVQEQNAIINAISLLVRIALFLYITYHYAPQYKFYLVIVFSTLMFIYQLGLFRINRVNIRRFQVVEDEVRARGQQRENGEENNPVQPVRENLLENPVRENPVEKPPESTESSEKTVESTSKTEESSDNKDEIRVTAEVGQVQEDTPVADTNQGNGMLGVVKSLTTLLYNLLLSFNPEFNVQEGH